VTTIVLWLFFGRFWSNWCLRVAVDKFLWNVFCLVLLPRLILLIHQLGLLLQLWITAIFNKCECSFLLALNYLLEIQVFQLLFPSVFCLASSITTLSSQDCLQLLLWLGVWLCHLIKLERCQLVSQHVGFSSPSFSVGLLCARAAVTALVFLGRCLLFLVEHSIRLFLF